MGNRFKRMRREHRNDPVKPRQEEREPEYMELTRESLDEIVLRSGRDREELLAMIEWSDLRGNPFTVKYPKPTEEELNARRSVS